MSLDDELWSCSLKANTSLYADDGVADIAVTTDSVAGTNLLDLLYRLHLVVKLLAVYGCNLTLLEGDGQCALWFLGGNVLQICLLRQTLCWVEQLAATDTGTPDTYIIRILQLGEVCEESILVQIVHLFLTCQFLVTCQSDNLHSWCHHEEGHVETNLVVACSGRTVCDGISANLVGIACNGYCLEDTLR